MADPRTSICLGVSSFRGRIENETDLVKSRLAVFGGGGTAGLNYLKARIKRVPRPPPSSLPFPPCRHHGSPRGAVVTVSRGHTVEISMNRHRRHPHVSQEKLVSQLVDFNDASSSSSSSVELEPRRPIRCDVCSARYSRGAKRELNARVSRSSKVIGVSPKCAC